MQNARETCMGTTFSFIFGTKSGSSIGAPPEKKLGSACNVYNMYLFIVLRTKTHFMCNGVSKPTPDLKILTRRDRAPRF